MAKQKCAFCGHGKFNQGHCAKCFKLHLRPIKIGAASK